eukprot:gene12099-5592_t
MFTTSATLTGTFTSNRTHTFQDQDGTVAHLSDIPTLPTTIVANYTSDLTGLSVAGTSLQPFVFTGTTFTKLYVYANVTTGTSIRVRIYDNVSGLVILEGALNASSTNQINTIDTVINAPAGTIRPFYVDLTRTSGSDTGNIFSMCIEA